MINKKFSKATQTIFRNSPRIWNLQSIDFIAPFKAIRKLSKEIKVTTVGLAALQLLETRLSGDEKSPFF